MNILKNKVAIVTGASSGIGHATAKLFAAEGADLIVTARRKQALEALVTNIHDQGGRAVSMAGNIQEEDFAIALVNEAIDRFGGLDIAFNNAGTIGKIGDVSDMSLNDWNDVIATNLTSAFLNAKYQIPAMLNRGGGSLIFTSTFVGYTTGVPGIAAYAASKAGLIGLTRVLASEHGAEGIRVNALLPGGTDTPMGQEFASSQEALDFIKNLHALKRIATPEEIACSALYLASDASSFTTGSAMLVDGGVSINRT